MNFKLSFLTMLIFAGGLVVLEMSGIAASAQSSTDRLSKKEFVEAYASRISESCQRKTNEIIELHGHRILCFHGAVTAAHGAPDSRRYSIAYVNSPGGASEEALVIGKEMHDNAAYVVVDRYCLSACANYWIPAARRIYMMDNTVIAMHGHLPRYEAKFVRIRAPAGIFEEARRAPDPSEHLAALLEFGAQFPDYFRDTVIPEIEYFVHIARNEAYVTRYSEVRRSLKRRDDYQCAPNGEQGLQLIIGPEYLDEFGIRSLRTWVPDDLSEYITMLPKSKEHSVFIFGFDEDPFWLPEIGEVTPEFCRTPAG